MNVQEIKQEIKNGQTALGIELGSTRIKAVLIGSDNTPLAMGNYEWENKLKNGLWTYDLDDVWAGIGAAFAELASQVQKLYDESLETVGAIGVSAMMHGYLAFDKADKLLTPFRTWRNTNTDKASKILTAEFGFNIPHRWSIAHLYQAILDNENHIQEVDFITTLAGYVHWKLTGEKVIGIGDASGMFPIDSAICNYDLGMIAQFNKLIEKYNFSWKLENILPKVLVAGEFAGNLTQNALGGLKCTAPLCPPEGDAGTGMVATNSVNVRTGNVSAGTSIFLMAVLEKNLSKNYHEIDIVTTPDGKPVAMVHCNNCSSDLDAWIRLFGEVTHTFGLDIDKSELYNKLYSIALDGENDGGGLLAYNYYSGEPITGLMEGRPLLVRTPQSHFSLANLMKTLIYSAIATLKIGMDILSAENISIDELMAHGGLFKAKNSNGRVPTQSLMASALDIPIATMQTAGEGGAWGIAILAKYALFLKQEKTNLTLSEYLAQNIFANSIKTLEKPINEVTLGYENFMEKYKIGIKIEQSAIENF